MQFDAIPKRPGRETRVRLMYAASVATQAVDLGLDVNQPSSGRLPARQPYAPLCVLIIHPSG